MHHTHDKGDIAEAAVILDLTKRGFTIFKPLSQNTYADIIVMKDGTTPQTIQIKFVTPKDGILSIPLRKQASNTKEIRETYRYKDTMLDWFAVYCPEPETVIYINRETWSSNGVALSVRLEPPKTKHTKGVRVISDYKSIGGT